MKPISRPLRILLLASTLGFAVAALTATAAPDKAAGGKPASAASAKTPAKKPAEEPTIPGQVIARNNGGFLGLTIVSNNFVIAFYDAEKKPMAVDVARATARWSVNYKAFDERAVLNPSPDGMSLTSTKFVRPPFTFKLFLTLLGPAEDSPAENFVIDVRL